MKKFFLLLILCLLAVSLGNEVAAQPIRPRIGIAGIQIENSVFMPNRQDMRGNLGRAPNYPIDTTVINPVWLPSLQGGGVGRGPVTRESYEIFVNNALEIIKANMPYDAFWFNLHGACNVEGIHDPEGEFLEKIRGIIGNDALVTTTMDLHGNVSWRIALYTDFITTYRMAPHEDSGPSTRRGVMNLLDRLVSGKGRPPYKAWVAVPVLLSGEWSSTRVEPAKSLYAMVPEVEAMPGVIDAGVWIGYVWGDERRNQGVVMVYGDDKENVEKGAKMLAQKFWDVRREFSLEAPGYDLQKCLDLAIASDKRPFLISDMGDNPGGGGSGEVTWTLARVLERPEFKSPDGPTLLYCSIPGNEMVEAARKAGVGGHAEAHVGAMLDNSYEPPVLISGTVVYVSPAPGQGQVPGGQAPGGRAPQAGQAPQGQAQPQAQPQARVGGGLAIIKVGSVYVVVGTSSPTPNLRDTGVEPSEMDIIMVKQGYLVSQWYDMQADWVMAMTPGGVNQDFKMLPYERIIRPMFPIDPNMPDPELNVIMVPSAKYMYGR